MPGQRRRFSPQFKAEAMHIVIETGKPIAAAALDRSIEVHAGQGIRLSLEARHCRPAAVAPISESHAILCMRRYRLSKQRELTHQADDTQNRMI